MHRNNLIVVDMAIHAKCNTSFVTFLFDLKTA